MSFSLKTLLGCLPVLIELGASGLFLLAAVETRLFSKDRVFGLFTCAFYGWFLEEMNIKLFGTYHYPDVYLLRIGDVPIWIPLGWALIIHGAMAISDRFPVNPICRPLMDGLLVLMLDLAIDAVAIRLGFWHWTVPWEGNRRLQLNEGWFGVPTGNLTGWMWVAASYSFFTRLLFKERRGLGGTLLREALLVPLAYAGLLAGIYFTGFFIHAVGAKSESERLWVFGGQVFVFLALCFAGRSRKPDRNEPEDEAVFTFGLLRWGAHLSAFCALIIAGIWRNTPALVAISLITISIEVWLSKIQLGGARSFLSSPTQCHISISVVIPAYNEEGYLPATLAALMKASALLTTRTGKAAEIIVVDNQSTDKTASIARLHGARVVSEATHNIARVRNTGADAARGDVLVFVDADTIVPELLFVRICNALSDINVDGGAFDTLYRPKRIVLRLYLGLWRLFGRFFRMAQGPTQFARREAFAALGGYKEHLYMGEDVDFYWRLKKFAAQRGKKVKLIRDLRVVPSTRRFDRWPLWRTLIWTNPLWVTIFQRRSSMWNGWYSNALR